MICTNDYAQYPKKTPEQFSRVPLSKDPAVPPVALSHSKDMES